MRPQPDFTKLFFEHFGTHPRKVGYEIRQGASRLHDLVFLESLIHDATFSGKDVRLSGGKLTITMDRDCWELPSREREEDSVKYIEMYSARARLTVAPVERMEWSFLQGFDVAPEKELSIRSLWLGPGIYSDRDTLNLVIDGVDWKCSLQVKEDELLMKVRDVETPYYYSERHKAELCRPPDAGK